MVTWYYLYIDDPQASFLRSGEFTTAMNALGLGSDGSNAAIYAAFDWQTGGVHYYFTPGASAVALMFAARPWNIPSRQALGDLLVGDTKLVERLYP